MTRHYLDLGSASDWLKRSGTSFQHAVRHPQSSTKHPGSNRVLAYFTKDNYPLKEMLRCCQLNCFTIQAPAFLHCFLPLSRTALFATEGAHSALRKKTSRQPPEKARKLTSNCSTSQIVKNPFSHTSAANLSLPFNFL